MTPGIHLVHKPVGSTSFSIVQSLQAEAHRAHPDKHLKICHGGTLDPFAGGLLLVLVGQGTKLFEHLHAIPKVYEATVRWGIETDNGDPFGKIVAEGDASSLSQARLDEALGRFIGWQEQVPPTTSARRVDGERAYVKAHRGEQFDMPPVRVYLHEASWLDHDLPRQSRLRIVARGGYYVRALARDLGRVLGCRAHLTQLHRSAIGPWSDPGPDQTIALTGRELLPWAPSRILTDQEVGELRQDRTIPAGTIVPPEWTLPAGFPDPQPPVRGFHLGRLACLLRVEEQRLRVITALRGGL